jgi:hypothetical protein
MSWVSIDEFFEANEKPVVKGWCGMKYNRENEAMERQRFGKKIKTDDEKEANDDE